MRTTRPALEAHYRFVVCGSRWYRCWTGSAHQTKKFTLADQLQSVALDILEALIQATYTSAAPASSRTPTSFLEKLRFAAACRL